MEIEHLERNAEQAATLLSAMANAKRLMILCNLYAQDMTVGQLMTRVGLAQSPLSQHLSKLRALNLVNGRRDGQMVYYSLSSEAVRSVIGTLYGIYCVTAEPGN